MRGTLCCRPKGGNKNFGCFHGDMHGCSDLIQKKNTSNFQVRNYNFWKDRNEHIASII